MSHHDDLAINTKADGEKTNLIGKSTSGGVHHLRQQRSNSWNDLTFGEEARLAAHRRNILNSANRHKNVSSSFCHVNQGNGNFSVMGSTTGNASSYAHTTTTHKLGSLQHRRRISSRKSGSTITDNSSSLSSLLLTPPTASTFSPKSGSRQRRGSIGLNNSNISPHKFGRSRSRRLEYRIVIVFPFVMVTFIIVFFVVTWRHIDMFSKKSVFLEQTGISVSKLMMERMGNRMPVLRGGSRNITPFPISIEMRDNTKPREFYFDMISNPIRGTSVLEVPKFWSPSSLPEDVIASILDEGEGMTAYQASLFGSFVNSLDGLDARTIFVGLVNYQNSECRNLVFEMLEKAQYPQRVRFAIVDQIEEESETCNPNHIVDCSAFEMKRGASSENNGQRQDERLLGTVEQDSPLSCQYSDHIDTYKLKPDMTMGTVFTRHLVARMYRGEYYALLMDAHAAVRQDWDVQLIEQLEATHNEMAIITTHPLKHSAGLHNDRHRRSLTTEVEKSTGTEALSTTKENAENGGGRTEAKGDAFHKDPRIELCDADFVGDNDQGGSGSKMLKLLDEQPENIPAIHGRPQLQPYWSPDFSFSRGHFLVKVKPDPYLPTVYMSEDISISIRAFTHGYDFYAPEHAVAFYSEEDTANDPSSRRGRFYLDKLEKGQGVGKSSLDRLFGIVKLNPHTPLDSWKHDEEEKYGLGKVRDFSKFFSTFGIHAQERVIEKHLCNFVSSGAMHKTFHEHLRADGMGIDYSRISFRFHELFNVHELLN